LPLFIHVDDLLEPSSTIDGLLHQLFVGCNLGAARSLVVFNLVVRCANPLFQLKPIFLVCALCDKLVSETLLHDFFSSLIFVLNNFSELSFDHGVFLDQAVLNLDSS